MVVLTVCRWVRIKIPPVSETGGYLRSMTCHPIGNQLLIIGGHAPGHEVDARITCNRRMLNIVDMNNPAEVAFRPQ